MTSKNGRISNRTAGQRSAGTKGKTRSQDVSDHLGVYTSYDEVPPRYRLANFNFNLAGRDVWSEYLEAREDLSEQTKKRTYKWAYNAWASFIVDEHHTHPALARPDRFEAFIAQERSEYTDRTVYKQRFAPLYGFYDWLAHHVDYPHRYNVALLAAAQGKETHEMWLWRWQSNRE